MVGLWRKLTWFPSRIVLHGLGHSNRLSQSGQQMSTSMLMPSKLTQTTYPVLRETRLGDIAPIFSLIQLGSHHGHFSNLYTRPRYMAGLGMQLFSLWKNGQIRLPDGIWHRAEMKVLSIAGEFAGFIILRSESSQPDAIEIYMCGVQNEFMGNGLGEWMLRTALGKLPYGCSVVADCLPNSVQMKSLLKKLGFVEAGLPESPRDSPGILRFGYAKVTSLGN